MVSTYAIMPAAGHGRRMGAVQPKQYLGNLRKAHFDLDCAGFDFSSAHCRYGARRPRRRRGFRAVTAKGASDSRTYPGGSRRSDADRPLWRRV